MSYTATWCPVCDRQVSAIEKDTERLLAHVRKYHRKTSRRQLVNQEESTGKLSRGSVGADRTSSTVSRSNRTVDKRLYAARVDTWKSHNEKKLCPQCQREAVPTLHARGDKLATSHMGALCLLGCWPLCFIPLMMKRARKVRMLCPLCGYVYGTFEHKGSRLTPSKEDSDDLETCLPSPPTSYRVRATRDELLRN